MQRHLVRFGGKQPGLKDGGEAFGGELAVLALASGDRAEEFGDGVGGDVQCRIRWAGLGRARGPQTEPSVDEGGLGGPAQAGQPWSRAEAFVAEAFVAEGGRGAGGGLVPFASVQRSLLPAWRDVHGRRRPAPRGEPGLASWP